MKIPQSFVLMSQTIEVQFDDESCHTQNALGYCDFNHNKIILSKTVKEDDKITKLPKTKIEQTFFHELAHILLYLMGENKLSVNEKFVDVLGSLIYQFNITKK